MQEAKDKLERNKTAAAPLEADGPDLSHLVFGPAETEAEIIAGIEAAREEFRQGRGIPHAEAMKHIRETIAREARRGKAL